jgi:hypothetical protein
MSKWGLKIFLLGNHFIVMEFDNCEQAKQAGREFLNLLHHSKEDILCDTKETWYVVKAHIVGFQVCKVTNLEKQHDRYMKKVNKLLDKQINMEHPDDYDEFG